MSQAPVVVSLFGQTARRLPEQKLDVSHLVAAQPRGDTSAFAALDLSGRHKVYFVVGRGRVGKSTLLRWIAERAFARKAPPALVLAAVDQGNRSLSAYFEVDTPQDSDVVGWLGSGMAQLIENPILSVGIDFGGGDTSLTGLLQQWPDLAQSLTDAGIEPVLVVLLGPAEDDLTVFAALDALSFRPPATLLVPNLGLAGQGGRAEFAAVLSHSVYRAAVERGAVQVWMPRNYAAPRLGQLPLLKAGKPEGGLGVFDRSRVETWLRDMEAAFAPVANWLP
jgi:hypothetical protein